MSSRSSKAFRKWKERMGISLKGASGALGISINTAANYCVGKRSDKVEEIIVPKYILLACQAVEKRLPPVE